MKGVYCLVVEVGGGCEVAVGKLGVIEFLTGFYVYVGSALNSLESRVGRHLKRGGKRLFWHIDYLLMHAEVVSVVYAETLERKECEVAGVLSRGMESVPGFGCSDCNCRSHLFYCRDLAGARAFVDGAFREAGLRPRGGGA